MPKNNLLNKIHELAHLSPCEKVPNGFLNIHQWAKLWGMGVDKARRTLKQGHTHGILEKKMFVVKMGDSNPRATTHWREKK